MFYHGTNVEMNLGDRILVKRWFRKPVPGVICYISGISRPHPELEYDDVKSWAYRLEDGTLYSRCYDPDHRLGRDVGRHIVFVSRGETRPIPPEEVLDEWRNTSEDQE